MNSLSKTFSKLTLVITVIVLSLAICKPIDVKAATPYFVSHVAYDTNLVSHTVDDSDLVNVISDPETGAIYIYKSITYGTTMYCDLKGNIEKVKDSNGKVLKDFTKEPATKSETREKQTTAQTTTASASKYGEWSAKGKKPTYKKIKKTYKGPVYSKKKHAWGEGKIKYTYGYKITWGKTTNAKGYLVQRYAPAEKKWVTLKTTKSNKKSKRVYTLTDTMKCIVKIRIVPYKNVNGKKVYGKPSKTKKFTSGYCTELSNNGWQSKTYTDKFFNEYAFCYQNKLREEAGVKPLKWSNVLYDIGIYRLKKHGQDGHWNMTADFINYAEEKGVSREKSKNIDYWENLSARNIDDGYKHIIDGWKNSEGHYRQMTKTEHKCGAYVSIDKGDFDESVNTGSIATFSQVEDFDQYFNSLK